MIRPDAAQDMRIHPPARIYVAREGEEYRTGWYYFTGRSGTYDTDSGPSLCFEYEHEHVRETRWGTGCVWMDWGMRTFQVIDQAVEPDRRALPRTLCGAGDCTIAPSHPGAHRGACGCANGCKAWECPNL